MTSLFPPHFNLPEGLEQKLLEATRRHWTDLTETQRDLLTQFLAGGPFPGLIPFGVPHHPIVTAWYFVLPTSEGIPYPLGYPRAAEALAELETQEP